MDNIGKMSPGHAWDEYQKTQEQLTGAVNMYQETKSHPGVEEINKQITRLNDRLTELSSRLKPVLVERPITEESLGETSNIPSSSPLGLSLVETNFRLLSLNQMVMSLLQSIEL